jgi:hypothetical protein
LLLCASGIVTAYEQLRTEDVMARTARSFLASLSDQQKARAVLPYSDEKWQRWHYFPDGGFERTYTHGRPGLVYKEMTPPQRRLADALLAASLSQAGFIKAATIMSLEDFLRTTGIEPLSDSERYYFCFFGTPSPEGTWRLRVEGHHVSLNFTMKAGEVVSASPMFLGSNPHEVREGPLTGMRILGREEDLARNLMKALSEDQRRLALIDDVAYPDIVTGVSLRVELEGSPRGLQGSKMSGPQWDALMSLIAEYASNVPLDITAQRMKAVEDTPREGVYFAWAGSLEAGQGHYYRVQGPAFLVEYDNTLNNNNHSHTVWRNPKSDFGLDVFALHHRLYDHGLGTSAAD